VMSVYFCILQVNKSSHIHMQTPTLTKEMKRTTIMLKDEQARRIDDLARSLDVDSGKVIRWTINTMNDIAKNNSVEAKQFRSTLQPQAKYLLDTWSSMVSK
jgi:hypothetical protein